MDFLDKTSCFLGEIPLPEDVGLPMGRHGRVLCLAIQHARRLGGHYPGADPAKPLIKKIQSEIWGIPCWAGTKEKTKGGVTGAEVDSNFGKKSLS